MTTLTVAERIAQIKQDRINGTKPAATKEQGFWYEHARDIVLRKADDAIVSHQARAAVAAELRAELAAQRRAEGYRW